MVRKARLCVCGGNWDWCLSVCGERIDFLLFHALFDPLQASTVTSSDRAVLPAPAAVRSNIHSVRRSLLKADTSLSVASSYPHPAFPPFHFYSPPPLPSLSSNTPTTSTPTHAHAAVSTTCYSQLQCNGLMLCNILLQPCFPAVKFV